MLMRHLLLLILTLLVATNMSAREKPYDNREFRKAADAFNSVAATADPKAITDFARKMQAQGRKTGNYRVEMLYYDAINLALYYNQRPLAERMANYDAGIRRAKELGSNKYYWSYKDLKVRNQVYEDLDKGLHMAEAMLSEATAEKSAYGIIKAYGSLAYFYSFRNENQMAADMMEKALAIGEPKMRGDTEIAKLVFDDVYTPLITYYLGIPDSDDARQLLDKMEAFLTSGNNVYDKPDTELRMMDIYGAQASIAFLAEDYTRFGQLLQKMKQNAAYDSYIAEMQHVEVAFDIMLYEHRYDEAWQLIEQQPDDVQAYYRYTYFNYRGDYQNALREYKQQLAFRDSMTHEVHLRDMQEMDTKMGNAELRVEKAEMQSRQRLIILLAAVGIAAIIIVFITVLYLRNRLHT